MDVAKDKLRCALREAVLSLCNNALDYSIELSIEGLIGVTLDKHDVFLVTLNEVVRSQEYEDLMAPPKSPQPQHDTQGKCSKYLYAHYPQQLFLDENALLCYWGLFNPGWPCWLVGSSTKLILWQWRQEYHINIRCCWMMVIEL